MESNAMTSYKDTTPAARLDNQTLNKMVWRSCQLQAAFNYERMQSAGWLWAILPGLEKIHTNSKSVIFQVSFKINVWRISRHQIWQSTKNQSIQIAEASVQ